VTGASPGTTIAIPVTWATLLKFTNVNFMRKSTLKQRLMIRIALLGHEIAHWISGEPSRIRVKRGSPDRGKTEWLTFDQFSSLAPIRRDMWVTNPEYTYLHPTIMNIINDVNDMNVVPKNWSWIEPYTRYLTDITFWLGGNIVPRKGSDPPDFTKLSGDSGTNQLVWNAAPDYTAAMFDFERLHTASIQYIRQLRIRYDNRILRGIPEGDPIAPVFAELRTYLREVRKHSTSMDERAQIIVDYTNVLFNYWLTFSLKVEDFPYYLNPKVKEDTDTLADPVTGGSPITGGETPAGKPEGEPSEGDGSHPEETPDSARPDHMDEVEDDDTEDPPDTEYEMTEDDPVYSDPANRGWSEGKAEVTPTVKVHGYPHVDQSIANRVGRIIHDKLAIQHEIDKIREPEVKGKRLTPKRFSDLYTRPDEPRVWRKPQVPSGKEADAHLITVYDKSGSMRGEPGEISRMMACTFLSGLWCYPSILLSNICFGRPAYVIYEDRPPRLGDGLETLWRELEPDGENDVPHGLMLALDIMEKSTAKKKLIMITNDGDYGSKVTTLMEQLDRAQKMKVPTIFFDMNSHHQQPVEHPWWRSIFIDDIQALPEELMSVSMEVI
jgi:hypothetical protein